jgi:hypothetical protein
MQMKPGSTQEDYGEAEFSVAGAPEPVVQRGKHWNAAFAFSDAPDGIEPAAVWAQIKPALTRGGWTFVSDVPGQEKIARYQKDGHDTWFGMWVFGADDLRLDLVEVGSPTIRLKLQRPAAKPETINPESGDFPYLAPIPGSTGAGGRPDDVPMIIDVDVDKTTQDKQVVGSGSIIKSYSLPAPLSSTALFVAVYRDALTQVGWKIVHQVQGVHATDAILNAHYCAGERDIWVSLHSSGDSYTIQVADAGVEDLGKELDRDCHIPLYGVHFDFNKATLRPDSDPVLEKLFALLQSRPQLKLEVQGHTDNVGGDDYNQKLSEARAGAVVGWLHAKSIASDRLTSRGYGLKMPIADNDSDEGRAKNRRVEIKEQGCSK